MLRTGLADCYVNMGSQKKQPKTTRRSTTQARGELRRKQLIEATITLLQSAKVQNITYADIAEEAGIPLPSCYHFFQNRLDLLAAVSEHLAPLYREATLEKEITAGRIDCWEDIIAIVTERSRDFFRSSPAAREMWLSGHVAPAISVRSREREFELAIQLKKLFCAHFELPDIPRLEDIFYITHEIGDRISSISQMLYGDITDFMATESKRAKQSYLRNYLPPVLKRVD